MPHRASSSIGQSHKARQALCSRALQIIHNFSCLFVGPLVIGTSGGLRAQLHRPFLGFPNARLKGRQEVLPADIGKVLSFPLRLGPAFQLVRAL